MNRDEYKRWIIERFESIDDERSLKRNHLSVSSHSELYFLLKEVLSGRTVTTVIGEVADWCKRNKLDVRKRGIGWVIRMKTVLSNTETERKGD